MNNSVSNYFLLNNVRSIENVGSMFRIADSLGWGLILQGITPHPEVINDSRLPYEVQRVDQKLRKTGVQTIDYVPWYYFKTIKQSLNYINQSKLTIYSLEEGVKNSKSIFAPFIVKKPFVLVLGNEKSGIDKFFLASSSIAFYIPIFGSNNSMNVSISAAVAGYTLKRQTSANESPHLR